MREWLAKLKTKTGGIVRLIGEALYWASRR